MGEQLDPVIPISLSMMIEIRCQPIKLLIAQRALRLIHRSILSRRQARSALPSISS